jgi:hypothetical protein
MQLVMIGLGRMSAKMVLKPTSATTSLLGWDPRNTHAGNGLTVWLVRRSPRNQRATDRLHLRSTAPPPPHQPAAGLHFRASQRPARPGWAGRARLLQARRGARAVIGSTQFRELGPRRPDGEDCRAAHRYPEIIDHRRAPASEPRSFKGDVNSVVGVAFRLRPEC